MTKNLSVRIGANPDEWTMVDQAIESFSMEDGWDPGQEFQIRLVLEELLLNTLKHGGDAVSTWVQVEVAADSDAINIVITDNGVKFNPLKDAPQPDLTSSVEDRKEGGLGVHLVRTMMDELAYRREGEHNVLTLRKNKSQ